MREKNIKKPLSILCIIMLVLNILFMETGGIGFGMLVSHAEGSLDNVFIGSATAANNSSGIAASDANSGTSPSTAVATFARAKALLKTGGTIWVEGPVGVTAAETWDLGNYGTGGSGAGTMKRWDGTSVTFTAAADTAAFNKLSMVIPSGTSANITLTNITIDGNSSAASPVDNGRTVTNEGQIFTVMGGATVTLGSAANLQNNYAHHAIGFGAYGGAFYIDNKSTVNMAPGSAITGCYGDWGAAVFAATGGTFNMTGGTISGCAALSVANPKSASVRSAGGTLNLSGGEITGNSGNYAVAVEGILNLSGTINIHGNTAGGVDKVLNTATVNVSGGAIVTDNVTASGTTKNINIAVADDTINVTGKLTGSLGITVYTSNHAAKWEFAKGSSYTTTVADAEKFSDDYTGKYVIENTSDTTSGITGTANTIRLLGYRVIYDGNGSTGGSVPVDSSSATYISTASFTVLGNTGTLARSGYTFADWNENKAAASAGTSTNKANDTVAINSASHTFYAAWKANTDTAYKVEHYKVSADGTSATKADTDNLTGTTAVTVNATAKNYSGYTYQPNYDQNGMKTVSSGAIAGDGSLTLKLYYAPNSSTVYKVNYIRVKSDGATVVDDSVKADKTGTTGSSPDTAALAAEKNYTGYTYTASKTTYKDSGHTTAQTGALPVAGDGSLVISLYYVENGDVTLTYTTDGKPATIGTVELTGSTNTASAVTENVAPATGKAVGATAVPSSGYSFEGWYAGTQKISPDAVLSAAVIDANAKTGGIYSEKTFIAVFTKNKVLDTATVSDALALKTAEGSSFGDKTFYFNITAEGNAPEPEQLRGTAEFSKAGTKAVDFGTLTFTEAGTYRYTVTEEAGQSGDGWTYDPSDLTATVTVSGDGNGGLTAEISSVSFTNTFELPSTPLDKELESVDTENGILYANYSYKVFNDSSTAATDVRYEDQMVNLDAAGAVFDAEDSNGNAVTAEVRNADTAFLTFSRLPAHTTAVVHARIPVADRTMQFSNSIMEADNDPGFDIKKVRVEGDDSDTETDTALAYGDDVWFMIRLDNGAGNANLTADLTKVTDTYGSGLVFREFGKTDGTAASSGGKITWDPGDVAAGASASVWIHFTVSKSAATEGFAQNKIATANKTTSVAVPVEHELLATPSDVTVTKSWSGSSTHRDYAKFQLYVVLNDGTTDALGSPKEAIATAAAGKAAWTVEWTGEEIASLSDADANVISTATVSNATGSDAESDGALPNGTVGYSGNKTQVGLNNVKGYYVQEVETPDGWTASSVLTVKGGKASYAFTNTWTRKSSGGSGGSGGGGGGTSGVVHAIAKETGTQDLTPVTGSDTSGVNADGEPYGTLRGGLPKTGDAGRNAGMLLLLSLLTGFISLIVHVSLRKRSR